MVGERRRLRRRRGVGRGAARVIAAAVTSAAVVVIVVGALARIGPASGPDRRIVNRSFAVLAAPVTAQSNATGAMLRQVLIHGPTFDRTIFLSDLGTIASDAAQDADRFAAVTPPAPAAGVAARCGATMHDRARGAALVRTALDGLLGGPDGHPGGDEASAVSTLVGVGTVLRSADVSWAACRRILLRAPGSARLPGSVWVTDRGLWADAALGRLVASLAGSASLLAVHRIALVTVTTDPTVVPGAAGVSVLPATSALTVDVVVANQGNVDERGVKVTVSAVPQGTAPAPATVRATTDISAGSSVAVTPPPLQVGAGISYVLTITATSPATGASTSMSIPLRVSVTPTTTTTTAPTTTAPTAPTTATTKAGATTTTKTH